MPFTKTSNLKSKDIVVTTRTLRQRKITHSLTNSPSPKTNDIVPSKKQNSSIENEKDPTPLNGSVRRRSSRITSPKTCIPDLSQETKDKQRTLDDPKLADVQEERAKRIYRKKSVVAVDEVLGPRKRSKPICRLGCCPPGASHNSTSDVEDEESVSSFNDESEEEEFIPRKRAYRKQSLGENRGRPRKRPKSVCSLDGCCGALSSSFVEIDINLKRKLFRKKQNALAMMNDTGTNSCPSSPASYLEIDIKRGKRVYRKKGFLEEDGFSASSPKNSEFSNLNSSPSIKKEVMSSPESSNDAFPQSRSYSKRALKLWPKPLEPTVTCPDLHDDNASPLPAVSTPKRRIPKAPHNTPVCVVKTLPSPEDSNSLPPIQKRGRGRPRRVQEASDEEWGDASSTTLSADTDLEYQASLLPQSSLGGSKPRRSRARQFPDVKEEEEEEEPISEYELMRQRNIQENLQMLRQIFMDSGLDLNEKTSEETKTKKPYTRLPLPPPRPKSARLEVRKSTGLLDFSKFSRKISLD